MSKLRDYLDQVRTQFASDPADTDFQDGYQHALDELRRVAEAEGWLDD